MNNIVGIYSITNKVNNKIYIGQSVNIYNRWKSHICELNNNHHYNGFCRMLGINMVLIILNLKL